MPVDVRIREILKDDAEAASRLSAELGYPVSAKAMARRIEQLQGLTQHVVYVACVGETIVGWIDVAVAHHLQADPFGEIGGLVVASQCRSAGIGERLLDAAEGWMAAQGIATALVRSRASREAAHRFYLRHGYARTKTSEVFSKALQSERKQ